MCRSTIREGNRWIKAAAVAGLMAIASGLLVSYSRAALIVVAVVALGSIAISLIQPAWLFTFAYPLLIPIGQVPISIGGTQVSLERLLIVVGSLGFVAAILSKRLSLTGVPRFAIGGFALWFGMYSISLAVYPTTQGIIELSGYLQKAVMAYMVSAILDSAEDADRAFKLFLLSSFLVSLVAIAVYLRQGSLSAIRVSSLSVSNVASESMLNGLARAGSGNTMAVWIALVQLWQAKNQRQRAARLLIVGWFSLVALFALRREVLVTLALGLVIMFVHRPIGHRSQVIAVIGFLFAVTATFVLSSHEWMNRLTVETVSQLQSGSDPRLSLLLHFTPRAVLSAPLVGYGPGNYAAAQLRFPDTVPIYLIGLGGSAAHNVWSAAAVEAGVGAFLGLCVFLYGIGRPLWQYRDIPHQDLDTIWRFMPIMFTQVLVSMFFGNALILPATWFWFGLFLAAERVTREGPTADRRLKTDNADSSSG